MIVTYRMSPSLEGKMCYDLSYVPTDILWVNLAA
jgi:hypothetical protein